MLQNVSKCLRPELGIRSSGGLLWTW